MDAFSPGRFPMMGYVIGPHGGVVPQAPPPTLPVIPPTAPPVPPPPPGPPDIPAPPPPPDPPAIATPGQQPVSPPNPVPIIIPPTPDNPKPTVVPDVVNPVIVPSTGPYHCILELPMELKSALHPPVIEPAKHPCYVTAMMIGERNIHCDNRPYSDLLMGYIKRLVKVKPWVLYQKLAADQRPLDVMIAVESAGNWNAIKLQEEYVTKWKRYAYSYGLGQLNERWLASLQMQATACLGSLAPELPNVGLTSSQLSTNTDPGIFVWGHALCHRPEALLWILLNVGMCNRLLGASINLSTLAVTDKTAAATACKQAVANAKKMYPTKPWAVLLRAFWINGSLAGACSAINSGSSKLGDYLRAKP